MATKDMRVIMKENIPQFQRVYPFLDGYLEAIGTTFNTRRQYIEDFDFAKDPNSATEFGVDKTLRSIGFEIPANTKPAISRTIMRDAMQVFARKGSTDSLIWALKVIGITPTVRQAWMPSPDKIAQGKIVDPLTGIERDYVLDEFAFNDFLYGDVEVTPDGNFFKGFRFNDPREEVEISGLPIKGEVYPKHPENFTTQVSKLPYVAIRIDDENFNVVTGPYTDENGRFYEYGLSEEFEAAVDLIEYFLYDLVRPTAVRILLVSSVHNLADNILIGDNLVDKYVGEELFESQSLTVGNVDGSTTPTPSIAGFPIGQDPVLVGRNSPYYNGWMGLPIETVSDGGGTYTLTHGEDIPTVTSTYPLRNDVKVPILGKTTIVIPQLASSDERSIQLFTIGEWTSLNPQLRATATNAAQATLTLRPNDARAFLIKDASGAPVTDINITITNTFTE